MELVFWATGVLSGFSILPSEPARSFPPFYANAAQKLWAAKGLEVRIQDFTRSKPPEAEVEKFNLVICNPPYVRHHHLDSHDKDRLRVAVRSACGANRNSESVFVMGIKMMMPHIGRITDNKIELLDFGLGRFRSSKVLNPHFQAFCSPKLLCGICVEGRKRTSRFRGQDRETG